MFRYPFLINCPMVQNELSYSALNDKKTYDRVHKRVAAT